MPKFEIHFTHSEENTYSGYVIAETEEEALAVARENPFDMEGFELYDNQGIDCFNFQVAEKLEEEE